MLIHTVYSYGRLQASRAANNHDNVLKRLQSRESREPFCILSEAACRDGDGTCSAPATTQPGEDMPMFADWLNQRLEEWKTQAVVAKVNQGMPLAASSA